MPARSKVLGGDIAHELATDATTKPLPRIQMSTLAPALKQARDTVESKQKGRYENDSALPGKHTRLLYDKFTYKEAKALCQLRTKHSRLNNDLARMKAVETTDCECGHSRETARHFLFECPRWIEQRKSLLEAAGARWEDLSFLLGGRTEQKTASGELLDGPPKSWKPDVEVVNQTIQFALATGRLE